MVSDLNCTAVHDTMGSPTLSKYQHLNREPKLIFLCTNNKFDEDPVKTRRAEWMGAHNYRESVRLSPRNRLLQQVNCTHSAFIRGTLACHVKRANSDGHPLSNGKA